MRATLLSFAVFFVLVDQFALSNAGNCTLYSPPTNGALVCNYIGSDPTCQVQCKQGYDFEFTPPLVYYCSEGEWKFFSFFYYEVRFPWPNCTKTVDSYNSVYSFLPYFDFNGDCNDPNIQVAVKGNFLSLMNSGVIISLFCKAKPSECNINTVQAYCGDVTTEKRRRKRIAVKLLFPLESQQGKKVNKVTNA